MRTSHGRTILAGLAGGLVMNLVMLLTFRLIGFGLNADGILLDPSVQSKKLIAIWTEIEPLPLIVTNPAPIISGIIIFGVLHAYIYNWISSGWKHGVIHRGLRFGLLVFIMSFLFWEFFTPFNQFGEPIPLIGLELTFWALIAFADGLTIAMVIEKGKAS